MIKNRYTGCVGEVGLAFNPKSRRYFELTSHEREVFLSTNGDIKKLVDSRISKYGTIEPCLQSEPARPAAHKLSRVRIAVEQDISNAQHKLSSPHKTDASNTELSEGEGYHEEFKRAIEKDQSEVSLKKLSQIEE